MPSVHENDKVSYIIGHLRGRCRRSVFEIEHTIVQLSGHTNNHVVKVRIKVFTLGDVHSVGGFEMVASHDVVNVVDSSWS